MYNEKQIETIKKDVKDMSVAVIEYLRQCLCDEYIANTNEKSKLYTLESWSETNQCLSKSFGLRYNDTIMKFELNIENINIGDE